MNELLPLAAGALGAVLTALVQRRQLRRARHDALTGLPTRHLWTLRAKRALRRPHGLALVMCDGDHVKVANDLYGHEAGDALIRALGSRLQNWAGSGRCVGRLGGDEFVLYVRYRDFRALQATLDHLSSSLACPVLHQGLVLDAGASIGAVLVDDLTNPMLTSALKAADQAMYLAKTAGGSRWSLAEPSRRRSSDLPQPSATRPATVPVVPIEYLTARAMRWGRVA